jgi:hypothetical protein
MKNFLKYTTMLLVVILMASCEDFLDVNEDPNNPVAVSPELVLPVAQLYTANTIYANRYINVLGNMMMYNWSQSDGFSWYYDEFNYSVTSTFYQEIFNYSYRNTLKQYQILEGLDAKYDYYKAISKIMKAYHFQLLVDIYGDVPYSEALKRGGDATPKYDNEEVIYTDLMAELTEAITIIDAAVTPVAVTNDIIFDGDMLKWKQFANTIKMRILVRVSDMATPPVNIATEIAAINTEGSGFITADVAVNPGFVDETNKQNPYWAAFGKAVGGASNAMNNDATCATDYVLTYLASTNDLRINRIYEKPTTGHLGVPQGLLDYDTPVVDAYMPDKVSNIGPGLLKAFSMDAIIFTFAEHNFNLAEAANKSYNVGGTAQSFYEAGITASFTTLGLTAAQAATYYNQTVTLVGWTSSPNKLQAIITQKWIAVNGMTAEQSWFDYNRTGYPAGLPNSLLAPGGIDRPVRLYYPAGEYSSNGANVPTQPDAFTAKIFWAN